MFHLCMCWKNRRLCAGAALFCLWGLAAAAMLEAAVPLNDLCLSAIVVPAEAGYPISYHNTQSTLQATSTGDPLITCVNGPVNGVWYKFTPLVDGQLTVRTAGKEFGKVPAGHFGGGWCCTQL